MATGIEKPVGGSPVASFAAEAHLPADRRLLVDGSGLTIEIMLGIRHHFSWNQCQAVLLWSDRAELQFNDEVSVVVRAIDWHRGSDVLETIAARAPAAIVIRLPDNPEPEPEAYVLRGLAKLTFPMLVPLTFGCLVISLQAIWASGIEGSYASRFGLAAAFALITLFSACAMCRRWRVPPQWRDSAARRTRVSVKVQSSLATASDSVLHVAEPAAWAVAGLGWALLAIAPMGPPPILFALTVLAFLVSLEKARRRARD